MKKNGLIALLVVIILGMAGYLFYDKVLYKEKDKKEINDIREQNIKEVITNDDTYKMDYDASKALNTTNDIYFPQVYGHDLTVLYDSYISDQKKLSITYKKNMYSANYDPNSNDTNTIMLETDKKVIDICIATFGVQSENVILLLMDDGTVEYIPIIKAIQNNDIRVYGTLEGIENVVKFVSVYSGKTGDTLVGSLTVLAQKADGTFYDLGVVLLSLL